MRLLIFLLLIWSSSSVAGARVEFECTPIEGETSFRVKGYFHETAQGENIGMAHSYAILGEYETIKGCRAPWYEKFPISGSTSVKFMLHWHEYMPGCMQRFMIPQISTTGHMWVSRKGEPNLKSKMIRANCDINRVSE
ncbi:hypothetical protein P3339_08305 [Microbulbifer sp. MLAF003]|uniref:hypothetical protein n=1 Tax=Microbulbifer TaxID=48073 RepID=UPI00036280DF|nr:MULTISPECIES: hypothetical protein [Microbulbifer]WHI52750.1 hypothetical protein P3339_08305 [Microbulbifer sp. MLAF003]